MKGRPPVDDPIEEETDPELRALFEQRRQASLDAVDAVLASHSIDAEQKQEIAELLHQVTGVAAYFGEADLGERCRVDERRLLQSADQQETRQLLEMLRPCLAGFETPPS